jgi:hypothetical protein
MPIILEKSARTLREMSSIEAAVARLSGDLDQQFLTYCESQDIHFEWLQSVAFQLRMYSRDREHMLSPIPSPSPQTTRSLCTDSSKLLDSLEMDDCLSQVRSHSFNDKFPIEFEEIPLPSEYEMSDDESDSLCDSDRDGEIYQKNPFEIHGKTIPLWARQEALAQQLKRQRKQDPDPIFCNMPVTCSIERMFGAIPEKCKSRL